MDGKNLDKKSSTNHSVSAVNSMNLLSDNQLELLDQLNESVLIDHQTPNSPQVETSAPSSMLVPPQKDLASFLLRYSNVQQSAMSAHDEKSPFLNGYTNDLLANEEACNQLLSNLNMAIEFCDSIVSDHEFVCTKTNHLVEKCQTVLTELETLNKRYTMINQPLPYFIDLLQLADKLGFQADIIDVSPSSSPQSRNDDAGNGAHCIQIKFAKLHIGKHGVVLPTSDEFRDALQRIDECIVYLSDHNEYRDSASYLSGYRSLMALALSSVRNYAISALETAKGAALSNLLKQKERIILDSAEVDITTPYYLDFFSAKQSLHVVVKEICPRVAYEPYAVMLSEVIQSYSEQRIYVLNQPLSSYVSVITEEKDIVNMVRMTCTYMIRICQAEFQLFEKLFGVSPISSVFLDVNKNTSLVEDGGFQSMIFQLSGIFYNAVRPVMIHQYNLETLCEIVQVLRHEIVDEQIRPKGHEAEFVEPVLDRMVQDTQERLIFCAQRYIRDEIEYFSPRASDLDYPSKLSDANETSGVGSIYATWFPTLEHTLLCLSKIYRYVDVSIFEELAQEAIRICTASLKMASADITVKEGEIDGILFLVKHLLVLREQITPFDIQFSVTEKCLDFTSTSDAMSNLLSDAFSFSMENSIVSFITRGIPNVHETKSYTKKDLEQELKFSCTSFIEFVVKFAVGPILAFLSKVAKLKQSNKQDDLSKEPFATYDQLMEIIKITEENLDKLLCQIKPKMKLYLGNNDTEIILFKPIQNGINQAVEQLSVILKNENQFTTSQELLLKLQKCLDSINSV